MNMIPKLPSPSRRQSEAGFTLVELLVSLTILALIMSFLPTTLTLGSRVWETQDDLSLRTGHSAFQNYVEQKLSEAMPVFARDTNGRVKFLFSGDERSLRFIAPAGAKLGKGAIYRFELSQREVDNSQNKLLVLNQQLHPGSRNQSASHGPTELVAPISIRALAIRYFGSPSIGQSKRWLLQWRRDDALPDLVEIVVRTSEPGARSHRRVVELRLRKRR